MGSVAAPTAGLHVTDALLAELDARGVRRVDLVLHVGAGTFKPVEADDPAAHPMHEEHYELSSSSAEALNEVRARGGKIWALGTTSARALESAVRANGSFAESRGETRLFVRPPYTFRGIDRLITNFHLPRSTLLMLVAALAGYDLTMRAYGEAVDAGYRFYSYGDAMAII
jgi:S-adenosylmethionine:tRNA ribosyltransferase-isomerase